MSSRAAPTGSCSRAEQRAVAFAALLLAGCAVGVDGTDEGLPVGSAPDTAVVVDSGLAPIAPVLDAGPTFAPLPPSLSTPQEASVPPAPIREAGAPRAPTGTGRTGSDAGASTGTGTGTAGGGGSRGGTTSGGAGGGTTPGGAGGGTTPGGAGGTTTGCDPLRCNNECSLAGPLPCCTLLDTCGCTWAPGAYCL
jgi:hypothetical protein